MAVDPDVYVIRHTSGYSLYPFKEDISERIRPDGNTMDADTLLKAIEHLDVSIIISQCGGSVHWAHGCDVTPEILASAAKGD